MKNETDANLLESHAHCVARSGSFKVGTDFEAPAPAGHLLPKLSINDQTRDELWSFITKAASDRYGGDDIFHDAIKRTEFENGVREALTWYISDFQVQANIPKFRSELHHLQKAIEQLRSALPEEASSVEHFLFKTYTGEIFLRDKLRPSDRQVEKLQDCWQARIGFAAIERTLAVALRNIESAQSLVGDSKPTQHQIQVFVSSLARVWNSATGVWPKSGRNPDSAKQSGSFADFVRATNSIIPKGIRSEKLDSAIRAACKSPDCT